MRMVLTLRTLRSRPMHAEWKLGCRGDRPKKIKSTLFSRDPLSLRLVTFCVTLWRFPTLGPLRIRAPRNNLIQVPSSSFTKILSRIGLPFVDWRWLTRRPDRKQQSSSLVKLHLLPAEQHLDLA